MCVSKKWKLTINSREFQERHYFIRSSKSRDAADVLFVSIMDHSDDKDYEAGRMSMVLGSSVVWTVKFPIPTNGVTSTSCDGLLCLSHTHSPSFVLNSITGWHRSSPHSGFQKLYLHSLNQGDYYKPCHELGFGKDKMIGTYKPVWLYNSSEFGLDNVTTCEVFDFATNAWRYVLPASPYRIIVISEPTYLDGSLHWFTQCEDTKVLSFDLHTETFQVISKPPFAPHLRGPRGIVMSILNNRLCVSQKNWPTQVFWSFDDSSRTWETICSIDLTQVFSWFGGEPDCALEAVEIIDQDKLLLHGKSYSEPRVPLLLHHLHTKSFNLLYKPTTLGRCVCYFQSLLTVL
ncbi:F-box protein [Raphanus sativus]|nr:F-box protein [Raphanus sativus]